MSFGMDSFPMLRFVRPASGIMLRVFSVLPRAGRYGSGDREIFVEIIQKEDQDITGPSVARRVAMSRVGLLLETRGGQLHRRHPSHRRTVLRRQRRILAARDAATWSAAAIPEGSRRHKQRIKG